ncbi:APC family permease [Flavitalea sp. BT771]|uniref:APC family permease n=1 Tax=Flavitalea sp. BT771 TaxID=3063329 RepID=UPI0026E2F5B9|nr:APC family permease [Flavitalea sp. BT771]MDO6434088.1 APC family permease [Flavitalea sp. BT771]MDV6222988.1 APC family permease [Flavitalea sp. BT771]
MTQKKLSLFDLTMIVVSLTVGMGIFRTPVVAAANAGTPAVFFLAWLTGGLVALCGALTYAEIGSRYPVTGGYYKIFSYGYHPSVAFAVNCIILVSNAGSTALVAVIGAEYIGHFFFEGPPPEIFKQGITIGAVAVFYIVNMLGIKMSSRVQNALILIKISLILLLLLSVFGTQPTGLPDTVPASAHSFSGLPAFLKGLGVGLIAVSFTYGGYQQSINFGGDVQSPSRVMPKGITYGITIIILLYLSINFVYVKVIGFESLKHADAIAAILINHLFGPIGENILRVLMFLSVLAYVNVLLMSNPRVMYAMADEGILPAAFKKKTKKHDAIVWSLTAFSLVIIITLLFTSAVEKIINYTIFLDSIGMSTSAACLFILRKRRVGEESGKEIYRMKLFPLLPLIFILAYMGVAASIVLNDPLTAAYGALILAIFFIVYFVVRYSKSRKK